MLLFHREYPDRGTGRVVALFGAGMIGSAVGGLLETRQGFTREYLPLDWREPSLQTQQLQAIGQRITSMGNRNKAPILDVLWSAGKAGFAASEAEVVQESQSFTRVLSLVEDLARQGRAPRTSFVLISSAGGLFEGQRSVTRQSVPVPRRPYGRLKWEQERLLLACSAPLVRSILRLSSVYGYIRPGQRRGLITTLILNGLTQRISYVFGKTTTLRHFVWIDDLARYLVNLMEPAAPARDVLLDTVSILAGDKPTSILEVQRLVEKTTGRKLYVTYSLDPSNREDITFAPDTRAVAWNSSDLALTIRRIHDDAFQHGLVQGQ